MTSKRIYGVSATPGSDGRYHYVYRITNLVENKHYYGKRTSKKNPYDDLGSRYFSSSRDKNFILCQKNFPEIFIYKIISMHEDSTSAIKKESEFHIKFDVAVNRKFYNRCISIGKTGFDPSKKCLYFTDTGEKVYISKNDPRVLTGELKHFRKGFVVIIDENSGNKSITLDEYKNGDYKHVATRIKHTDEFKKNNSIRYKNTNVVIDLSGKIFRCPDTDERYISGEYRKISERVFLCESDIGERLWVKSINEAKNFKIIRSIGKRGKTIYHTPWGEFDSLSDLYELPENIDKQNIKLWTRFSDQTITEKHKIVNIIGIECIGKTMKEIGFYRL